MNTSHESFLVPFFKEMNTEFHDKWCVLHSYETLPYYSASDVDMAFSGTNIDALELLIKRIAKATEWVLLQKLWYDVQKCYYYVLQHAESGTLLAIDFLIDNDGISKYGFTTKALTKDCVLVDECFPIPNAETALCYKLVKRIVKLRSIKADETYLAAQFKAADHKKVSQILTHQFGKKGKELILKYLNDKTNVLSTNDIILLHKTRKNSIFAFGKRLNFWYWEAKRTLHRILFPCGMIIKVSDVPNEELRVFVKNIEEKVGFLFRFVGTSKSNSKMINLKGFASSSLLICPTKEKNKSVITYGWRSHTQIDINSATVSDLSKLENMTELFYKNIIQVLESRMANR